ncbi:MAG: DEAD/DEAH box helicase [Clostridia bacterium]|nr:DEAD/DEAH box helicase [Clostridia bacterium]
MYAEVIVDIASSEVDRIFEYEAIEDVYEGSRVSVPFGVKKIEGIVIRLKETCDFDPSKIKKIYGVIDDMPALTAECLKLVNYIKNRYHVPAALALRLFLPAEMRKGKVRARNLTFYKLNPAFSVTEMLAKIPLRANAQRGIIESLSEKEKILSSELNGQFGSSAVRALIAKGYVNGETERTNRNPYVSLNPTDKRLDLLPQQTSAIDCVENTDKTVTLIYGVTGSGKTEVYLNLIKDAVNNGKTAIMTVPEISLTPQMLSQLRARFGNAAAILHSGLSQGERFDEWWRLRSGDARIAIGARSAVFAPVENVGVIIIDEEHDGSYSSETSPRYNTVEIASKRAEFNGCKLILGSATPSIDSL